MHELKGFVEVAVHMYTCCGGAQMSSFISSLCECVDLIAHPRE